MEEIEHQPSAGVTEDPDTPVTEDVSAEDVSSPELADAEPVAVPETQESEEVSEPVITNDPDAPVTVEVSEADLAPVRDADVITADPEESLPPAEPETDTAPVLTADPDERLFPPGGSGEITPDEFLLGVEQPKADDEVARRLAVLEAIVYVTDEPLSAEQIAKAMNQPLDDVKLLLEQLVTEYNRPEHGLTVKEVAGGYKMATKPEHHEAVRTFVKNLNPPLKLSLAALETLAVIAYKQPITAPEIMEIRGVQGAGVLKTLIDRKLITTAGRKNVVGKPILYKTTKEFLVQFGLRDLTELPTLKEFEDLRRMAFSDAEESLNETADAPPQPGEAEAQAPAEDGTAEPAEHPSETDA
jgi:segregation and condensation protein B